MKRPAAKISAEVYRVIAGVVQRLPDPAMRKTVADHFATEFNRRSAAFDPLQWERLTGGRPAPNSAHGTAKKDAA